MDLPKKNGPGYHLSIFDKLFCIIILATGTIFGTRFAIGPVAWDDTLYLHTAMALARDPTILNRYTHIFLLRLGIFLAGGNPFSGAFLAGAFSFSLTAVLVYVNARLISKASQPWHGMIAVLFLLAEPLFLENFGIPLADYTAMLMISLGIFCFLVTLPRDQPPDALLALNGFVFFLAIKSKEICAVLLILLAALVFIQKQAMQWKIVLRRSIAIFSGVGAGLVCFILLDSLLLKDAWFGLRLSDFQALISFNLDQAINFKRQAGSYFDILTRMGLLAPFCFALISAVIMRNRLKQGEWAVWLLVAAILFGLTFGQIKGAYGVSDRYAIPLLPVLAILAPQFFQFEPCDEVGKPAWIKTILFLGLLIGASLGVYFFCLAFFMWVGKPAGWSQANFLTSITEPMALCLLLPSIFLLSSWKKSSFVVTMLLILVLTIPQIQIYRRTLVSGLPRQASLDRFIPMTIFKNQVTCTTGKVFVSSRYHDDLDLLSRDQQSSYWMFDLAFDCNSQIVQFDISNTPNQILTTRYQYAFIPKKDFGTLMVDPVQADRLRQMYMIQNDPKQAYYLLTRK